MVVCSNPDCQTTIGCKCTVVQFPHDYAARTWKHYPVVGPCQIVILPVVRIERSPSYRLLPELVL